MATNRSTTSVKRKRGDNLLKDLVTTTNKPGTYNDGRGLYLVVEKTDAGTVTRRWVFRFSSPVHFVTDNDGKPTKIGKRREMGLGTTSDRGLAAVRKLAETYREQIKQKIDPLDQRDADIAAKRAEAQAKRDAKRAEQQHEYQTVRRVARAYHAAQVEPNRTGKHGQQWINSIEQHVPANILDQPIADVTAKELMDALLSLRTRVRETGRRIGQRLGLIFAHAKLTGIIQVNPLADIKPLLREQKRDKKVQSHAALPFQQVPGFVTELRKASGIAALALEFLIRTAARTGEVTGMVWSEVDLDAGVWVVPKERMKAGEPHTVFLPARAVDILRETKKLDLPFCFPTPQGDRKKPMSNMAMLSVLKRLKVADRATVHGFRSSFSTWGYEAAARAWPSLARTDVVEAALAHNESDKVKAAYSRSKFDDDRKELLKLWSEFIDSTPAKVIDIAPGKQRSAA